MYGAAFIHVCPYIFRHHHQCEEERIQPDSQIKLSIQGYK